MINTIFALLAERGIRLWLNNDDLNYKAPKGALTDSLKTLIVRHKADLIQFLKQQDDDGPRRYLPVGRRGVNSTHPLSFGQQRLWLLDRMNNGSAHYNMPCALRLTGKLDIDALGHAFTRILERHESLRTCFVADSDDEPRQVFMPATTFQVRQRDLCSVAVNDVAAVVDEMMLDEASKPFDLSTDIMLRVMLLVLGNDEHVLLVTLHHIACDGWSIKLLLKEFCTLYSARVQAFDDLLESLPIQYADYADWQRSGLQAVVLDQQLEYWKHKLAGLPAVHNLPLDHPRPVSQTFLGSICECHLNSIALARLRDFCRLSGATLFMGLHAAFAALLSRYSNETDIVIGTPIANREQPEVANLIGFFVNTLVLRSDLSGEMSFAALMEQSKRLLLEAYEHQQVPFERIVECLQPERSLSHSTLFQVMLVLHNGEQAALGLPELQLEIMPPSQVTTKYDLTLKVGEDVRGLSLTWEYNTDLFEGATIGRMARHFEHLLNSMLECPTAPVFSLDLLDECERRQLLLDWNCTTVPMNMGEQLHRLFEAQVVKHPERRAIFDACNSLGYAALNRAANGLAHILIESGIRPGDPVPLMMTGGCVVPLAMLAVMKAGGMFAPIDMRWPEQRVRSVMQQLSPRVVLQDALVGNRFGTTWPVIVVDLQRLPDRADNPCVNLSPDAPIYVIHTSGSTGEPKGAINRHVGIVNRLRFMNRYFAACDEVVMQTTHHCFDSSVWQFFWPLLSGGSCFIPDPDEDFDAAGLQAAIARHQVTVTDFTPSLFAAFVEGLEAENWPRAPLATLKALVVGGDAIVVEPARRFRQAYPDVDLINAYGPTETAIGVVFYRIPAQAPERIPIGKPIDNVQVYVLDRNCSPVPVGVPGELYIAGACMGAGYWNAAEQTEFAFVANPFHISADPSSSSRMYRTGDLVRWLADGNLDYLGRMDKQVKIRGMRIEPAEIEKQLVAQPGVVQTVVTVRQSSDKLLVAFVVLDDRGPLTKENASQVLRQQLQRVLPDYMVPAAITVVQSLPLSASGKVDHKELALIDDYTSQLEHVAPRTYLERIICDIWQELLGVERVGVCDNFFELGGHSLTATRLVSRLGKTLGVKLPLRTVFSDQTPEALAHTLSMLDGGARQPSLRAVVTGDRVPLSFAQQRLWLLDHIDGGSEHYNMPCALRLSGKPDFDALTFAFHALIERHESLRTCFHADALGQPYQVVQPITEFSVCQTDLSSFDESTMQSCVDELIRDEASSSFALDRDLMIRAHLITLATDQFILLVTLHHIASDGWSTAILVQDLARLYSAFAQGLDNPLVPLQVQYSDYAQWQRNYLQGEVLDAQLNYWRRQLANLPIAHSVALDHPRPRVQSFKGATLRTRISASVAKAISCLCHAQGATLFMGLHSIFSVLLSRYSGETDIIVGTPIANREQVEIASLIGCFVNTLVLRSDLSGDPTFSELLRRNREMLLDSYTHQQLPFEQIVEALQPDRHMNHATLFQFMLVLQNNDGARLDLPGMTLETLEQDTGIAKYDLTLFVTERLGGLDLAWEYNIDIFNSRTIDGFARHFAVLLESFSHDPHQSIANVPLMSENERQELWNLGATGISLDVAFTPRLLPSRFIEQAKRQGDRIAVKMADKALSYQSLEVLSACLGRRLIAAGCRPNALVAVVMEKGWEQIVGVLGILRSGAAYLPVDAKLPLERIHLLLELGEVRHVVATHEQARRLFRNCDLSVICVDEDLSEHDILGSGDELDRRAGVDDLAYVIFTSGSTGAPKGVMITHRGASNTIDDLCVRFAIDDSDSVLALSNLSFDLSVFDIFGLLSVGGTVVLPQVHEAKDAVAWSRYLEQESITIWNTVPAYMQLLTKIEPSALNPSLRLIMMAGDRIAIDLPARIAERFPNARQINLGGNTEASIFSCIYYIDDVNNFGKSVPYGKALTNQHIFVFGSDLLPAPYGVAGEIYIGGAGVSPGYWRDAAKTVSSFIEHPLTGERMYKTGDMGRLLRDGNIEFIGRKDFQVKLRGYRIELGEIDNALLEHACIKDAVTATYQRADDDCRLVIYVVPHAHIAGTWTAEQLINELRLHLSRSLPDYMQPSAFMLLAGLPLSANGKVDRKALPDPDLGLVRQQLSAPSTSMEKRLCEIWQTVLGIDHIGTNENFFELGGHSLLVMQVIASLQQHGITATARQVFTAHTLGHLAALLQESEMTRGFVAPINAIPVGCTQLTPAMLPLVELDNEALGRLMAQVPGGAMNIQDIYPLGPLQEGMLFHNQLSPESDPYVVTTLIKLAGSANLEMFIEAVQQLVDRHDVLRSAFLWKSLPQPVQVVLRQVTLPVFAVELDSEQETLEYMYQLAGPQNQRMNLEAAPLLTLHVAPQESSYLVLVRLHHIIFDHVGMEILLRELQLLREGHADRLAPTLPYREFIAHLGHHDHDQALAYFRRTLGDVRSPTIAFGLSDTHGDGSTIVELRESVAQGMDERLRSLARQMQVTPATLFHVAWALVLADACEQEDVVFGSVVSGRLQGTCGVDGTLGLFINSLPVRIGLVGLDASQLVRHTHQVLLDLLPHEHASLAQAQQCAVLANAGPLFNTLLNCRHSNRDPSFEVLAGQERTSYPVYLGVDDYADEFVLDLQIDGSIDGQHLMDCMQCALLRLVEALETRSCKPVAQMKFIDESRRASWPTPHSPAVPPSAPDLPALVDPSLMASLAGIWAQLLEIEPPKADDDFFELGGNSLLVIRLVARVAMVWGVELPMPQVFATPTLAALAQHVAFLRRQA